MEKVAIVGGGVGGLGLAVALAQLGIEAHVYESSSEVRQRSSGAFLNLAPNGMRALDAIGLAAAVAASGSPSAGTELLNASGRVISWIDAGHERERLGFQNTMIRRADLHRILLDAAHERGVTVHWQRRVAGLAETGPQVTLRFDDGTSARVDAVVGADGLRSAVRQHVLAGADPGPSYLGLVDVAGFCGQAPAGIVQGPQRMVFGRHGFFGYYATPRGEVWWFANIPHRQPPAAAELDRYTGGGWRDRLLDVFAGDPPVVTEILRASDDPVGAWPITDLPTLRTWHTGRVCLLGDAAHASSPSAGQGASLALEDALVLAALISEHAAGQRAFASFERQRRDRTRLAVRAARRNTSSKAAGPVAARIRDRIMPTLIRFGAKQTATFLQWEPPTLVAQRPRSWPTTP